MNQSKLSFESENLIVDWIGFNIQGLIDRKQLKQIANYLFRAFGFNSTIIKRINGKWKSESLKYDKLNKFQVSFRQHDYDPEAKSFWVGTKIYFSGKNAAQIYKGIRAQKFDWNIFDLTKTSLVRFDLYYFRETKSIEQKGDLELFMEESCQKIRAKSKRRHASWCRNSKGLLMKIGSRLSSNHYRVYEKNHGLEFELELKNQLVKSFQKLLVDNRIKEFEHDLSKHFYKVSLNSFTVNSCYTDWLVNYVRKTVEKQTLDSFLITDYLENSNVKSFVEKEYLFRFFQFLTFIRRFKGVKQYNGDQAYYFITFPVSDFLQFISVPDVARKRQYQLKKILNFLLSLQKLDPIVENFSDASFRSSVIFPYLAVVKEGKSWVGKISISEQLYFYSYPFFLPKEFLSYKDKYEMEVKLKLIQSLSVSSLEKNFYVEEFLNQFSIPNKKRTQIKKLIIELFDQLKSHKLIETEFGIVRKNGSSVTVKQLTPLLLTKSKSISFHEVLYSSF